jgi:hypothetical protein
LFFAPLLLSAAPVLAQPAPADRQVPREMTDPATVEKVSRAMQSLSDAFLNLPVGEVQAALEGRQPTAADRRKTVRSESRVSERQLRQQIADAKPMLDQGMKQLVAALPVLMKSMEGFEQSVERAAANMPDPTYPKR